jgi:hypothetical protein
MTMSEPEPRLPLPSPGQSVSESVQDQARRRGIRPVTSVEEMARDDVFESDEELDAFLAHVYAERHANLT